MGILLSGSLKFSSAKQISGTARKCRGLQMQQEMKGKERKGRNTILLSTLLKWKMMMAQEFIMPLAAAGVQGENHRISLNVKPLQNVPGAPVSPHRWLEMGQGVTSVFLRNRKCHWNWFSIEVFCEQTKVFHLSFYKGKEKSKSQHISLIKDFNTSPLFLQLSTKLRPAGIQREF